MQQSEDMLAKQADGKNIQHQTYFDLGENFIDKGDWDNAILCYYKILEIDPKCGKAYNNLGLIFKILGQPGNAEAFLRKAIEIEPTCINAYYNLGFVYKKGNYLEDAEYCFRHVLDFDPDCPNANNNLGVILAKMYRLDEAEEYYQRAIELQPDYALAHYNLGILYKMTKRLVETEQCLKRASELSPDNYDIDIGLAFFYLLVGQFEKGWGKYAEALRKSPADYNAPQIRHWRGEDVRGRKIVLYFGKGLGDTLQFIRYARQITDVAAETTLLVQKPLQRLLAANFPSLTVYAEGDVLAQDYDFACCVQYLPIIFNTVEETIPWFPYYLQPLPEDVTAWHKKLHALDGGKKYRVGIVWAGNIKNPMDQFRSIPFTTFSQLLKVEEVIWISLQLGIRPGDSNAMTDTTLLDVSPQLVDFGQTAAVIANLDLVITMDTSVAHLAGAMGKRTWLLLDSNCDWRWHLDREDSVWYPSMRLFRQQRIGDWAEVLVRVTAALRREYLSTENK